VQEPSKKRGGKKLYVVVAAVAAIVIILVAVMFVPQGNADVISLGVDYSVGEKLMYDLKLTLVLQAGNNSITNSSDAAAAIEVLSFEGDTYTLNYTITSNAGGSPSTSKIVEVKKSEMVTALALLPVALPLASSENISDLTLMASFDQTEAKVGDTWTIPLHAEGSVVAEDLKITFKAIQDFTVDAGTYRMFRMDFSTRMGIPENQSSNVNANIDLTGQSYLELGTGKQIRSILEMKFGYQLFGIPISMDGTITSTLKQDL
jgi:hypothetical protein